MSYIFLSSCMYYSVLLTKFPLPAHLILHTPTTLIFNLFISCLRFSSWLHWYSVLTLQVPITIFWTVAGHLSLKSVLTGKGVIPKELNPVYAVILYIQIKNICWMMVKWHLSHMSSLTRWWVITSELNALHVSPYLIFMLFIAVIILGICSRVVSCWLHYGVFSGTATLVRWPLIPWEFFCPSTGFIFHPIRLTITLIAPDKIEWECTEVGVVYLQIIQQISILVR